MDNWTVEMVEDRLAEAAAVMRRLPPVRVPGYFNTWPPSRRGVRRSRWPAARADAVAAAVARRNQPDGGDAGLAALAEAEDTKLVWARAEGTPWKYALSLIAYRLNGRRLRRMLIGMPGRAFGVSELQTRLTGRR